MAGDKNIERAWAIVDKAGIYMLTTRFDGGLRHDRWKRDRPKT